MFDLAFSSVEKGGQFLFFSGPVPDTKYNLDVYKTHYNNITVKGVFHLTPDSVREARELLVSNKLSIDKLLTGTAKLDEIAEIFANPPKNSIKTTIYPENS